MTLTLRSQRLLDDARSETKRLGGDLSVVHLAAVLIGRYPDTARPLGSVDVLRSLVDHNAVGDEADVVALLERADDRRDDELPAALVQDVLAVLGPLIEAAPEVGNRDAPPVAPTTGDPGRSDGRSTDADPSSSTSSWLDQVGDFLDPGEVVGRDGLVDEILHRLGRLRSPVSPLLAGHPGTGRTAVLTALATRLADPDYDGPLAGHRVFRVRAHSLAERNPAGTLRSIARELGGDAVLCIDDLEVAAGFSRVGADLDFLRAVRSLVAEQSPRVLLSIDSGFAAQVAAVANELDEELDVLPVTLLGVEQLRTVVDRGADELSLGHGVKIPPSARELALAPSPNGLELAHPGLALARLDRACVRARLDHRDEVADDDLGTSSVTTGPVVADALADRLGQRVRGQQEGVRRIAERLALTRSALDLRPNRPDGVFLLVGPTGVGKTELAKAIADEVFGGGDSMIRLDMSEYVEPHSVSRITGPPPGYVGFTDPGGWLTTKVLERPDTVILLDEFEKAHPLVWNSFLQVFDDGRLTDSMGRTVDFSATVIMLTSNLGARTASRTPVGFGRADADALVTEYDERMRDAAKQSLAPELINRLDDVVVFHALTPEVIVEIAAQNVESLVERYRLRGFELDVPDEVVEYLASTGYSPEYGARHLHRNIERLLLEPLVGVVGRRLAARLVGEGAGGPISWTASG